MLWLDNTLLLLGLLSIMIAITGLFSRGALGTSRRVWYLPGLVFNVDGVLE